MRSGVFFSVIGGDFEVMLPMMNGSLRLKMRIEDFDGGVEDRSMKWTLSRGRSTIVAKVRADLVFSPCHGACLLLLVTLSTLHQLLPSVALIRILRHESCKALAILHQPHPSESRVNNANNFSTNPGSKRIRIKPW